MNYTSSVSATGILLPEFLTREGFSLEQLMRSFIDANHSSKGAKDLLSSASPSRARFDGSNQRLIVVEGSTFGKDLHTEEINRFAKKEGWTRPSFEDALRLYSVLSFASFAPSVSSIVVLHEPIRESVLGINNDGGRLVLAAHKAIPRKKGWYCRNVAFAFRSQ